MVKKNDNPLPSKPQQPEISANNQLKKLLQRVAVELKDGNGLEAMRLFTQGQARHLLLTAVDLSKQLTDLMGKKMASKLIGVLVHSPCPFGEKGRQKYENCDGQGHIDYEMVCVDCLSFGLIKCDFWDGSGWTSIDSIPVRLYPIALYQRTKVAMARIRKTLSNPIPQPSENEPLDTLGKCAQLLMDLNRYIGVLENTVVAKDELAKSGFWSETWPTT